MANKIFKHFEGTLEQFKAKVTTKADEWGLKDSIVFIHDATNSNSGWIYADEKYFTAAEVTGLTADELINILDGSFVNVENVGDKVQIKAVLQDNITSNLQTAVGYIGTGEQINVFQKGWTLDDVLKKIFCQVVDYTTAGTNNYALSCDTSVVEVGQTVTPKLTMTGSATLSYNKPVGGSASQSNRTLIAGTDYTVNYGFKESSLGSSDYTNSVNSQTMGAWKATEGTKTYYGGVQITDIKTANDLGLKKSDGTTASAAKITFANVNKTVSIRGAYKYYYAINTPTKLTTASTWEDCISVCATNGFLTKDEEIIDENGVVIGDVNTKKFVYALVPSLKQTPTFTDGMTNPGTMTVIKELANPLGTQYKLCAIDAETGNAGTVFKNVLIYNK